MQNSAVTLSLKLALAMVRPCGSSALAPADTLDICCREASNRRTVVETDEHSANLFSSFLLRSRIRSSNCSTTASKAIKCIVENLFDEFIAAPSDVFLWSANNARPLALKVCWMCLTCEGLGSGLNIQFTRLSCRIRSSSVSAESP